MSVTAAVAMKALPFLIEQAQKSGDTWRARGGLLGGELTPSARAQRRLLRQDIAKMESGELGYSDAQRMALLAAARRSMSGGTAEAAAEAQRAAAMGGSAGGAFQNQLALQANQSNALAQHAGVIEDASARQAALQRQEIRRRIDEAADRGRGFWSNMTKRQSSSSSSPPLDYTALESAFK